MRRPSWLPLARLGALCAGLALGCGGGGGKPGAGAGVGAGGTASGGATAGDAGDAGAGGVGGATGDAGGATGDAGEVGGDAGGVGGIAGAAGGAVDAGAPDGLVGSGVGGATGAGGRDYSTNRDLFFGASRCATAGVQLCEDFESGTLDAATWSTRGGKPVIDGLEHARGAKALHVTVMGNGLSAISETKTFPAALDTYFGRAFVYFKSLPTPATGFTYSHWTMIAASGTQVAGEIRVSGQMSASGASLWGVGTDNRTDPNGTGDWTNSDKDPNGKPIAVPTGQWLCIEWMHKGSTNETSFWWDGAPHPSLHTTPTTPHGGNPKEPYILPQFTSVWLGWQEYQTTTEPFELWLDEIAIDKDRIGCVL